VKHRPVASAQTGPRFCAVSAPVLLLSLLLSGCANEAPLSGPVPVHAHAYNETADIGGRFSAQFERNGHPESWTGSFSWSQTPRGTTVALFSPFGQTLASIAVNEAGATLTQSGQAPRSAANVDALAKDALGWPLPMSHLRDWLQAYVVDAEGRRVPITRQTNEPINTADGWQLNFASWQDDLEFGMKDVPKRIDMERDTAEAGKLQMRLIITSWQPN